MSAKDDFRKLLEPGRIGSLELKNRIIMPAMGTRFAGVWGEVNDLIVEYYRRRARGGCGLIIVECVQAATAVDPLRNTVRDLRADDTCYIPGLALLAEAIHEGGAKAGIQLSPGGGVQAMGGPWLPGYQGVKDTEAVSPSGVFIGEGAVKPRVLELEEIQKIVNLCGHSAWNAKRAGFDFIEIHAHGGYLIHQFLSPFFNKRTDNYGDSFDNRCRFLIEILASMRKAVGPDFPLQVKYSIEDLLPGGWDMKQSILLAQNLEAAGVNSLGISSGIHKAKMPATPPYCYPLGVYVPWAEAIKKVVSIPVVVGGRINDPALAEKVLRDGKADFICQGRALIADPDWPQKVSEDQISEIRPCLACNECRQRGHDLKPIRCAVNAVAGQERNYNVIEPAAVKKKVLIVGGGPAGMEAARIAALRGHEVILCEKQGELGGLMRLGGIHNEEITAFVNWMTHQIGKLPISVRLRTEVTPALVKQINPDTVILAIGGTFMSPKVPGIDRNNVFSSKDLWDLMNGVPVKKGALMSSLAFLVPFAKKAINASTVRLLMESNFPIKKDVAVIGGQFPGCSLALLLNQKGKNVTLIEETDRIGNSMEENTMAVLKDKIALGNVKVLTSSKVNEINDKGVIVIDGTGNKLLVEVDTVVIALEFAPTSSNLPEQLRDKVKKMYIIGDAVSFSRIPGAISEGFMTAYHL